MPGAQEPCYDGPPATLGKGICKGGLQTCTELGDWGACVGEILPAPENCQTAADEDCDGATPACAPGDVAWSRWLPVTTYPAYSYVFATRFDPSGDLVALFGLYTPGALDLGLEPLTGGPCGNSLVVAKFDGKTGKTLWQSQAIGVDSDFGSGLAVMPNGSIAITIWRAGSCAASIDGLAAPSARSILIVGPDGHPQTYLPLPDELDVSFVASRPNGLTLAGSYSGAVNLGNGVTLPSAPSGKGFVAALDAAGHGVWATPLGLSVSAMDTDASGATLVSWLESSAGTSSTIRVGALGATGVEAWSRVYHATNVQTFFGVSSLRAHNGLFVAGGMLYADADLGFGPVTSTGYNSFLLFFDAAGNQTFGKWLDQQGDAPHVDVDPLGGAYLSGGFNGFGTYLHHLATPPSVTALWSRPGGAGPIAVDAAGDVVMARTEVNIDLAYVLEKHAR